MNCPQCHGTGTVWVREVVVEESRMRSWLVARQILCGYDGCVNGVVHCCDGLKADEVE